MHSGNKCPSNKNPEEKSDITHRFDLVFLIYHLCGILDVSVWVMAKLSGQKNKYAGGLRDIQSLSMPSWAQPLRLHCFVTDLDGWFAGDVGDQEVHGDVLAVYVLVHHVPDSLGHHVGVQIGVVLGQETHRTTREWKMQKKKKIYLGECFGECKFWPCGRKRLLSGPWTAHRSSWSCRARTDGWRPTRDTSQGSPRCDLWPRATPCVTPVNPKIYLTFNQFIKTDCAGSIHILLFVTFSSVCLSIRHQSSSICSNLPSYIASWE